MVRSVLRVRPVRRGRVLAARVAPVVLAVPAVMVVSVAMVVLRVSVALPRAMVVPRARRALLAWRRMAVLAVRVLLVVPALTPRV
jgi:hypothetical protein